MRCFGLDGLAVGSDELAGHHSQATEALRKDIGLDVAVVVLARPDKPAGGLDDLRNHVVDEAMLVVNRGLVEKRLILASFWVLEHVRQTTGSLTYWS